MEDSENESLIAKERIEGHWNSLNCDPDGDENVAEICGSQPNPNKPLASSEIETIDEDRENPSLQTSGNCSGSTLLIVLGVLLPAIVVSIMAVNWAQLISPECKNKNMGQIVLIISVSIGLVSIIVLLCLRQRNFKSELSEHKTSITFLKIKLISLYIFGLGHMFHCG